MTCRDLIGFLSDYLDGSLEPASRAAFEEHLRGCAHCRDYLRTFRDTIALAAESGRDDCSELAAELPPALLRAVAAACAERG